MRKVYIWLLGFGIIITIVIILIVKYGLEHRLLNKVQRSLIRTDADEVTYNLHIMLRFDLELELLAGHLRVKDFPEAWRARMQADLDLAPADDRDGCLRRALVWPQHRRSGK
jgi:Zn-dependent M32 family carboxypeptidase